MQICVHKTPLKVMKFTVKRSVRMDYKNLLLQYWNKIRYEINYTKYSGIRVTRYIKDNFTVDFK